MAETTIAGRAKVVSLAEYKVQRHRESVSADDSPKPIPGALLAREIAHRERMLRFLSTGR